jgi:hypothetical protein
LARPYRLKAIVLLKSRVRACYPRFDEELLEPSLKVDAVPVSARFPECAHARAGRQVPGLPLDSLPMFLIELVAQPRDARGV